MKSIGPVIDKTEAFIISEIFHKSDTTLVYIGKDDREIINIKNKLTWLIPDITMEILSKLNSDSLKQKDVLNQLSKAEQQVAILLKDGLSNTKISEELKLSINTVKSHIKNIYLKLEVKDRFSFINLLNKK